MNDSIDAAATFQGSKAEPQTENIAFEAKNVSMRFGRNQVLSGIDMSVPEGSVYALLGRNGAGKSTLLQLALGLLRPTSGEMSVLGLDPQKQGPKLRQRIGYIPERLPLYDWMTIGQLLEFTAAQYDDAARPTGKYGWSKSEEDRLVAKFKLAREKKIKELSRGNLALVALVLAMAHEPELVLLDECTSGMDAIFRAEFDRTVIDTLHESRRTVIFASHQIRELEFLADWVGIMNNGKIMLQMPVEELKASVKALRITSDDGKVPPKLDSEIARQGDGREWLVTVQDKTPDAPRKLPTGVRLLETNDLSLEQIFVALLGNSEAE